MKLKGTEILLKVLEEEKVDIIFGYPGGAVLDIYDQLYKSNLKHILVRHEQGAVHAADGYARATGKVGVCLVTSGPAPPIPLPVSPRRIWIPFLLSFLQDRYPPV